MTVVKKRVLTIINCILIAALLTVSIFFTAVAFGAKPFDCEFILIKSDTGNYFSVVNYSKMPNEGEQVLYMDAAGNYTVTSVSKIAGNDINITVNQKNISVPFNQQSENIGRIIFTNAFLGTVFSALAFEGSASLAYLIIACIAILLAVALGGLYLCISHSKKLAAAALTEQKMDELCKNEITDSDNDTISADLNCDDDKAASTDEKIISEDQVPSKESDSILSNADKPVSTASAAAIETQPLAASKYSPSTDTLISILADEAADKIEFSAAQQANTRTYKLNGSSNTISGETAVEQAVASNDHKDDDNCKPSDKEVLSDMINDIEKQFKQQFDL